MRDAILGPEAIQHWKPFGGVMDIACMTTVFGSK
jgi:hypothetical protein